MNHHNFSILNKPEQLRFIKSNLVVIIREASKTICLMAHSGLINDCRYHSPCWNSVWHICFWGTKKEFEFWPFIFVFLYILKGTVGTCTSIIWNSCFTARRIIPYSSSKRPALSAPPIVNVFPELYNKNNVL